MNGKILELDSDQISHIYIETYVNQSKKKGLSARIFNEILIYSLIGSFIYFFLYYLQEEVINNQTNEITEMYKISIVSLIILVFIYYFGIENLKVNITSYILIFFASVFSTYTSFIIAYFWLAILYDLLNINFISIYGSSNVIQLLVLLIVGYPIYTTVTDFLIKRNKIVNYKKSNNFKIITFVIFFSSVISVFINKDNLMDNNVLMVTIIIIIFPYLDLLKRFG
ncbi:MAG: hypothetical protein ABS935_16345 [Solibacillus sp.]|uniref:hypothetical protein n=1 Tax=Solibacillus sp. TaxID=1909654 RepID=UPI003314C4EC